MSKAPLAAAVITNWKYWVTEFGRILSTGAETTDYHGEFVVICLYLWLHNEEDQGSCPVDDGGPLHIALLKEQ